MFIRGWGVSIIVAVLIATSFRSAIADWNDVPTGSMKPTIIEGDRIFVNKLAYDLKIPFTTIHLAKWENPKRGDIAVFFSPADGNRLVKRVMGLPGDTIAMHNNQFFINGKALFYEPLNSTTEKELKIDLTVNQLVYAEKTNGFNHWVMITPGIPSIRSFGPVTIPHNSYFMMGDNRDNSADSRFFGFVDRSKIVGRATAIVISLNRDKNYLPRWNRFFNALH